MNGQSHTGPGWSTLMSWLYLASSDALIEDPPQRQPVLQRMPSVTLTQSESCVHEVSNEEGPRSMHTPASGGGGAASTGVTHPFESGGQTVHAPSTHPTTPMSGQGHASSVMDAMSASYWESEELLMAVLGQSHRPEQSSPVATRVQSAATVQLSLKLEAST
jgi:hypothetical protein